MAEVRSLLVEGMRRHGLVGAAVALVRKGEQPAVACVGLADPTANRFVDPDTVFRIASISKTMTAIGLMQLRDRGLFGLDDPVNNSLRTFTIEPPPGGPEVTFRHLLTHTAGIGELPRVADAVRGEAWGVGQPLAVPVDLGVVYRSTLRPETVAGAKWAYANHGFAVLGQLIEDISGRSFAEHMHDHLFQPLGMDRTEYCRTERTADRLAVGHHWILGRLRSVRDYDFTILGAGSVRSSVTDMATYAEWLLHGGAGANGDVLRPETLAEMMTRQYSVDPRLPGMGLAFFLDELEGHRVAGHDGNVPGFASALLTAPDDGIAVVVLTNTATMIGAHLLAQTVLRSVLGLPRSDAELPSATVADQPHLWSDLVGDYAPTPGFLTNARAWQMIGGEAHVAVKHRRLVVQARSPLRQLRQGLQLHATDGTDPLMFTADIEGLAVPVAFTRSPNGRVDRLTVGPPANIALYRRHALRSSRLRVRVAAVSSVAATLWARQRRRQRDHR